MAALSLSTPASAPSALALDPDLAPVHWTGKEFESRADLDKAFYKFYEERGWVVQPMPYGMPRLQSVRVNCDVGVIGSQWQTAPSKAPVWSDDYYGHFDILVHKTQEEAETARKSKLKELTESLATVEEGSAEWHKLRRKIISYSEPVKFVQLGPRLDNERTIRPGPHIDGRDIFGQMQDVRVGRGKDPNVETWDRFAPAIRAMQRAKVLPEGEWQPGTTWGVESEPKSVLADEEDEEDEEGADEDDATIANGGSDRKVPSTFHGFKPRYRRPEGFGLGHHGYDNVYLQQRDGVHFTSQDVPGGPWQDNPKAPMSFTCNGEIVATLSEAYALKPDNPLFDKRSYGPVHAHTLDLKTRLQRNEKASMEKTAERKAQASRDAGGDARNEKVSMEKTAEGKAQASRPAGGDAAPPVAGSQDTPFEWWW